jgi:hypothetical protein
MRPTGLEVGQCSGARRERPVSGRLLLATIVVAQSAVLGACHSNGAAEDAGGASRPIDAGPEWTCLDQPLEVTTSSPVGVTFTIYDAFSMLTTAGPSGGSDFTAISYSPIPGIAIRGCEDLDPACAMPTTPIETTGDAGQATVTVPDNFRGVFELSGPGYLTAGVYTNQLLADASTFTPPIPAISPDVASSVAAGLNVPFNLDAGVGIMVFEVFDCFDRRAAGVAFSMTIDAGSGAVQYYVQDDLPSVAATETDSLGTAGALNVPAGPMTITGSLPGANRNLGSVQTVVIAGGVTFALWRVRAR